MIIPFKKPLSDASSMNDKQDTNEEISKTIKIFKSQREKLGISLEELSNKTKISRNVLIAIENGWNNSLSKFKFNFINIDFLNSWTGSLLYFIIMLFSILAINSQQKYLLKIHSISTEPVFINETNIENDNINNIQK